MSGFTIINIHPKLLVRSYIRRCSLKSTRDFIYSHCKLLLINTKMFSDSISGKGKMKKKYASIKTNKIDITTFIQNLRGRVSSRALADRISLLKKIYNHQNLKTNKQRQCNTIRFIYTCGVI